MPDPTEKNPRNVSGAYYNDLSCIDCDICRKIAPAFFTRDDEEALSYVWKQPITQEDIDEAEQARLACPTDTIGNDG